MALKYRTKGFVFKKEERSEFDQTFSIFTKDFGRIELKAKAIRKITSKLRSGIDIFYLSEIEFVQGKNSKTLTDAVSLKKNNNVFKNFRKLEVLCQIAKTLDDFIKGQDKDSATFDLLLEFFDKMGDDSLKSEKYKLAFQYFFWNFISSQGYRLQTENCACCRKPLDPYDLYFSSSSGGVICGDCSASDKKSKKINSDIVKVLRLILKKDWRTVSKLKVELSSQNLLEDVLENAIHTFCPVHC